jgi:Protein of unknown function (DUF3164)
MSTVTEETIDLSKATPKQLKEALKKLENDKEADRDAYKKLVTETLPKAFLKLAVVSDLLSQAKTKTFQYFENVLDLKNQAYGIKDKQRSHTFSSESQELTIGYRINEGWDDTATAGIAKVTNYINTLSTNAETADLVDLVFNLLKKDSKGNLKGSRVLELQALAKKRNNEEFTDGVAIIAAAYKPTRSSWFIEASLINPDGTKTNIPLSMSSVPFSDGYSFDFFNEVVPENETPE